MGELTNPNNRKHSLKRRSTKQLKPSDPNKFDLNAIPMDGAANDGSNIGGGGLGLNPSLAK